MRLIPFLLLPALAFAQGSIPIAPDLHFDEKGRLVGKNFIHDIAPLNADSTLNAVVEVPAGTSDKWETNHKGTAIAFEQKNGHPHVIKFLAYPGNYGFIPRTKSEEGGPIDVIVIGQLVPRGSVITVKLLGDLRMLDGDVMDDKLIAVMDNCPLYKINSIAEMRAKHPGAIEILETWFGSYKGPGRTKVTATLEREETWKILAKALQDFQ